ncbi:hypothetical protein OG558_32135 [Kribbella sp. NBC_01510]|uniref:hypothetical protein n=1 Tax=Kribbella sp. NBC_01510 TaxID=2903581 RepID=UPI00386924E2
MLHDRVRAAHLKNVTYTVARGHDLGEVRFAISPLNVTHTSASTTPSCGYGCAATTPTAPRPPAAA